MHGTKVPVIAVTGHLGSGKTTLLNHLLRRPGARLGVIVNDFGTLNVDAALVTGQIDEAAAISGGCLCCLPDAGGLDEALEKLSDPLLRLDAIILEASGVADPVNLARIIRFSGAENVRPGGVIDVIDAREHFRTIDIWPEPPARYAAATLVVVGKDDLLPEDERATTLARIAARVHERNPDVQVVTARRGRVDPELIFDVAEEEDPPDQLPFGALLRDEAHDHADHDHASAASVPFTAPVSPSALMDFLESPPAGAYRIKGRVRVRGPRGERGYLVNRVGRSIHVAPLTDTDGHGELVIIGMHLDAAEAQKRIEQVAQEPADRADTAGLRRLQRYRRLSE